MTGLTQIVTISVALRPMRSLMQFGPYRPFSEIFERDGRWLMGPWLLGDIVAYIEKVEPTFRVDVRGHNVELNFPLPWIENAVDGRLYPITNVFPDEVLVTFYGRLEAIVGRRAEVMTKELAWAEGQMINEATLNRIRAVLTSIEHEAASCREDTLTEIAANEFGLPPFCYPRAHMAVDRNGVKIP